MGGEAANECRPRGLHVSCRWNSSGCTGKQFVARDDRRVQVSNALRSSENARAQKHEPLVLSHALELLEEVSPRGHIVQREQDVDAQVE